MAKTLTFKAQEATIHVEKAQKQFESQWQEDTEEARQATQ